MELIQAKQLSFAYPESELLWKDLSFSLKKGSVNLLLGPAGAGKSTLLRHFIPKLTPFGRRGGEILYAGKPLAALSPLEQAEKIAFVMQDPEDQIVCDSVWHELAFAPENIGLAEDKMRLRIAETANFFGIQSWFKKRTYELSGGEKRVLNLASVLVLRPELLILDEPLARLDPIAAADFTALLLRVNRELGITILLSDHRAGNLLEEASQILFLDQGRMHLYKEAESFARALLKADHPYARGLPDAALISRTLNPETIVFNVRDAQNMLRDAFASEKTKDLPHFEDPPLKEEPPAVEVSDLSFRYGARDPLVLDHLKMHVPQGKISFIMGGNGSGKSTLLQCIAGLLTPEMGKIRFPAAEAGKKGLRSKFFDKSPRAKMALLPQNPRLLFTGQSLGEDFSLFFESLSPDDQETLKKSYGKETDEKGTKPFTARNFLEFFALEEKWDTHPGDLSGGELQRAGLAAVLMQQPAILLLDEAGKALTAAEKHALGTLLQKL